MASPKTRRGKATPVTELLLGGDAGQFSLVAVYKLIAKGFDLEDVKTMLSMSSLYSKKNILSRLMGKSLRSVRRQSGVKQPVRLNAQQSAVAFQYACVLEHAIRVFGAQRLAEEWLERPCRYLEGDAPLDVVDNALGFQAVKDYLNRIEFALYH
ncbi:antitoxin Xre/MbcA/ParS toxin-binding domain-containing protein [Pseudomonas frederiksbergensis]|uniref:antitoxin Xre/MbcA/ParS toxin-binding domain-containing protein n=1 Tax=Pseudomonas frederiksbergensis TaxID=104087 RepID=UPI000F49757A|nr:antitoxin Xre/MbcA/ParS toxin-binding domain-containing protein [Pseudomonas frederiksbergensis]RON55740.1 hypothetical protein BK667_10335 [Pseudomonas frederiksbergensis]